MLRSTMMISSIWPRSTARSLTAMNSTWRKRTLALQKTAKASLPRWQKSRTVGGIPTTRCLLPHELRFAALPIASRRSSLLRIRCTTTITRCSSARLRRSSSQVASYVWARNRRDRMDSLRLTTTACKCPLKCRWEACQSAIWGWAA